MSKPFTCESNSRYSTSSRWHQEPLSTHSRHACAIANDLDTPLHHHRGSSSQHDDPPHASPHRHHRGCNSVSPRSPVIDPDINVNGLSQAEYQNRWWQYIDQTPSENNPLAEGDPFFQIGSITALVGSKITESGVSNNGSNRRVTVVSGTQIFIPILTAAADEVWSPDEYHFDTPWTAEDSRSMAKAFIDTINLCINNENGIFLEVDGQSLIQGNEWQQYRQTSSQAFTFTAPENHVYGYEAGTPVQYGMADGYCVMLAPLSMGNHTIKFGGTIDYSKLNWDQNGNSIVDTDAEQILKGYSDYFQKPENQYTASPISLTYHVTVVPQCSVTPTNLDLSALAV